MNKVEFFIKASNKNKEMNDVVEVQSQATMSSSSAESQNSELDEIKQKLASAQGEEKLVMLKRYATSLKMKIGIGKASMYFANATAKSQWEEKNRELIKGLLSVVLDQSVMPTADADEKTKDLYVKVLNQVEQCFNSLTNEKDGQFVNLKGLVINRETIHNMAINYQLCDVL